MTYTVVYYELTRIERQVEADSVEHAVAAAEKIRWCSTRKATWSTIAVYPKIEGEEMPA